MIHHSPNFTHEILKCPVLKKLSVSHLPHFLWKSQTIKGTFLPISRITEWMNMNKYIIDIWCFWRTSESHSSLSSRHILEIPFVIEYCWFHGSRANLILWTFFRAITCCLVCHSYCFSYGAANMAQKMSKNPPFDSTQLRWFDLSQSERRKNNGKTFEGTSVEPTKLRPIEVLSTKFRGS